VTNPPDLRRLETPDATISYRVSGAGPGGAPLPVLIHGWGFGADDWDGAYAPP
jgi:pimeloyl-ACP methyl ester carboxylesterase